MHGSTPTSPTELLFKCRIYVLFGKKVRTQHLGPPLTLIGIPGVPPLAQRVWESRLRAQLKGSERLFFPALRLSTWWKG